MSYADAVYSKLTADATLTTPLTGGLYLWTTLDGDGLTPQSAANAYENGRKIKPCLVVKGRSLVPFSAIKISQRGYQPARQAVEIWLYQDRAAGFGTIRTAAARVKTLLNLKRVTNSWKMLLAGELEDKEPAMQNTNFIRLEFTVVGHTAN